MASSSPSPSPSYFTHLPLPPSSTFLSGEKSLEDDGSRVSIHIVTTASQLPVEFLEPSPQTQLVIGFDCEGVDLCRNGTHFAYCSSLIEAFCMAILEAASCGLLTVSTRVGGVPEVLPDDMIVLAEPDPSDMVRAIQKAVTMLPNIDPQVMHNRMRELYSWHDVARRTEIVYDRALKCSDQNLLERLSRYTLS